MIKLIKYLLFLAAGFFALVGMWIVSIPLFLAGLVAQTADAGTEIIFSEHLFLIGGHDRLGLSFVNRMVASSKKEDITEDQYDEIYFFGLSEMDIQDAIEKGNENLPFVITSYTKVY
jgi:hypothetical protein